jgi:hypothetical protein
MKYFKTSRKDYYGGLLLFLIGMLAVKASISYQIGDLSSMGPGFFPCAVGALMGVVGVLIAITARGPAETKEEGAIPMPHGLPDWRGCACIVAGTAAFVWTSEHFGLLPATFLIVFITAMGDRANRWYDALCLAGGILIVATIVFYWGLQIQMPLLSWEF